MKWNEPDPIDDVSMSSFDCPYPDSPPKGDSFCDALVLALPFRREIGANKFVLSVISEGCFLPFVSLPDCLFFNKAYTKKSLFPVAKPLKTWLGRSDYFFILDYFFYSCRSLIQMNTQDMYAPKHHCMQHIAKSPTRHCYSTLHVVQASHRKN